jgi:hypothetical protein
MKRVAYLALKIIVTSEEKPAGDGKGYGCDTAYGFTDLLIMSVYN